MTAPRRAMAGESGAAASCYLAGAAALAFACALGLSVPAQAGSGPAKLYTQAQAQAGQKIYRKQCSTCHGKNLQGISGPPIAGKTFLKKAKMLGWSVADMRHVVVNQMPADNPGSLSPKQYAAVEAYIMARNCYPAGSGKFPEHKTAALKQAKLAPLSGVAGEDGKRGTCPLSGGR